MTLYLPDTHAIDWYEVNDPKLSSLAANVFTDAEAGRAQLAPHPIVLAELRWLLTKVGQGGLFVPYPQGVRSNPIYRYEPVTMGDIGRLDDFAAIPEMHDRLIAITADRIGASVVTRDPLIRQSTKVRCVW